MQVAHTQRCCGACSFWSGSRDVVNGSVDPKKYTVLIKILSNSALCMKLRGSNEHKATASCGQHSPMIR